jgi:probable rRNA maturation factor
LVVTDNRQTRVPLHPELLREVEAAIEATLAAEGRTGEVSLSLVDDVEIQTLNRLWRGQDKPTDVLSFPLDDPDLLGDVVISVETALRQAEAYGHSLRRELGFLAVHGTLHLLGYDHDTAAAEADMMARTEAVLARLGLGR